MPLAFESLSHGTIAFGFFNIKSDMLLMDQYFFFADDFCKNVEKIAGSPPDLDFEDVWKIYHIADPKSIGDLNGAIHGIRYSGFIGEVYRRFPFPEKKEDFKQKANGHKTRSVLEEIIQKYARVAEIKIAVAEDYGMIDIGSYCFARATFHELLKYVWRGGYPRWKDGIRPESVLFMKEFLSQDPRGLFGGIRFTD